MSQLLCLAALAADTEDGVAVGSEADTEVGTAAYTAAEAEAVVWPLHGTAWKRQRRRWKSPGRCG